MTMPDRIWLQQSATGPFKVLEPHDREFYRCTEYILASTHTRAMEALREAREALERAREDIGAWGAYAGDYFQEKHALRDDIEAVTAALSRIDAILKEDAAHD